MVKDTKPPEPSAPVETPDEPKNDFKLGDHKKGHRLLKENKRVTRDGRTFIRTKDVKIKKGDKEKILKNITLLSYVPDNFIKAFSVNEKHFEPVK